MPKLKCLSRYRETARRVEYEPGAVVEADAALAAFLMADAPGSFEEIVEAPSTAAPETAEPAGGVQATVIDAPARTTALRRARRASDGAS